MRICNSTLSDGTTTQTLGTYSTVTGQAFSLHMANASLLANTSYSLIFTGLATSDQTAFIDNVALTAVPEPATWAMFVLGFGLVGLAKRRRSAAVSA